MFMLYICEHYITYTYILFGIYYFNIYCNDRGFNSFVYRIIIIKQQLKVTYLHYHILQ